MAGASFEAVAVSRSTINQAITSAASAKVDLDKTKKSVAENIRQAEKTLADLESSASNTPTAQEQALVSAQTALVNAQQTGQKNINNTRSSALLALNDKILSVKIALDNLNTILEDDNAEAVLSVKNSALLTKTKDARLSALSLLPATEKAVTSAKVSGSEAAMNTAGDAVQLLLAQTDQSLDYAYAMLEATIFLKVDWIPIRL